ncbi:MAG: hypothetical protein INF50_00730 [Rhodobacter sp.]|nr:hypothetical protein [Rhodobacter sp.]
MALGDTHVNRAGFQTETLPNQDAIAFWIDTKVPPEDMTFASTLSMMTEGTAFRLQDISESTRTAHCRSVERTAKHYGFIE